MILPPSRWLNSIGAASATPLKPLRAAHNRKPPALPGVLTAAIQRPDLLLAPLFPMPHNQITASLRQVGRNWQWIAGLPQTQAAQYFRHFGI
jgi:hypothetical protein